MCIYSLFVGCWRRVAGSAWESEQLWRPGAAGEAGTQGLQVAATLSGVVVIAAAVLVAWLLRAGRARFLC
jgi:hypothetical protein